MTLLQLLPGSGLLAAHTWERGLLLCLVPAVRRGLMGAAGRQGPTRPETHF